MFVRLLHKASDQRWGLEPRLIEKSWVSPYGLAFSLSQWTGTATTLLRLLTDFAPECYNWMLKIFLQPSEASSKSLPPNTRLTLSDFKKLTLAHRKLADLPCYIPHTKHGGGNYVCSARVVANYLATTHSCNTIANNNISSFSIVKTHSANWDLQVLPILPHPAIYMEDFITHHTDLGNAAVVKEHCWNGSQF